MPKSYTGPPIPQFTRSEDTPPMSGSHALHAMPEIAPGSVWSAGVTNTGTFLRVGSVVPVSMPLSVLTFDEDGVSEGSLAQQVADRLTAEIRADLDAILKVLEERAVEPEPESPGSCGERWPAELAGDYICTGSAGHSRAHKAHDGDGKVLASYEADVTVAAKPVRRRTSPRKSEVA